MRGGRTARHFFPFSLSLPILITLSLPITAPLPLVFSLVISLPLNPPPPWPWPNPPCSDSSPHPPHRFESSLDVDALAPRHGGVGETIPGAAAARDVHSLPPQVPEGFRYHQNCIMGQRWSVLRGNMTEKANDSKRRRVRGGTKSVSKT